ncbi:type II toxin-antitoxin system ParD family antitoxin [Pedobacter jejuensis]|uniref:Type II toxin-antitoxin system ParD family antitoxin n=1 Tax=Pedobacter jejuensis TaxID=1268550 RepID=A0A3N0BU87_9SPHI|nr:type II toxin-antitoxin system ParD family antitoxin [Pedobacter jejuensis]RNL52621.1 type II toxin-antitoxin system ParD family antitoxin [Pedobacter jejuensis]
MGRNTSMVLGNHFESFVEDRIAEGRFKNASEVIRAGLRLLEEEEHRISILKNAIKAGLDSGAAHDFNPEEHLKAMKAIKIKNG